MEEGQREGPRRASAGEGEVGSAATRLVGPPHPPRSRRPAGGEALKLETDVSILPAGSGA
jgi:hypothetical protein